MGRSICGYGVLTAGLVSGIVSATALAAAPADTVPADTVLVDAAPAGEFSPKLTAPSEPSTPAQLAQQNSARPTLRLGSVGESVSELQSMLSLMGYYSGAIDGFYREQTQTAVVNFQADAGIINDGIVGPSTWEKLFPAPDSLPVAVIESPPDESLDESLNAESPNAESPDSEPSQQPEEIALPILRQGMYGPAVTRLQTRLQALGFYNGPIDGEFGPQTEAAVQAAQVENQIEADGVVGPATWAVLLK